LAEKKQKQTYKVTILSREEVMIFPEVGRAVPIKIVTYVAGGLPPASIEIPSKEWTLEREQQMVRKDIERRLAIKPETYEV